MTDPSMFIQLCKEMLELGAVQVKAGAFEATFRAPQLMPAREPRREPKESDKPPTPKSADEARYERYGRLMGGG